MFPVDERSEPLEVALGEPLDRSLLLRLIRVKNDTGAEVPGVPSASSNETRIIFTPNEPWSTGTYHLLVDPEIEDLAGNKPGRLFDQEIGNVTAAPKAIELRFEVR